MEKNTKSCSVRAGAALLTSAPNCIPKHSSISLILQFEEILAIGQLLLACDYVNGQRLGLFHKCYQMTLKIKVSTVDGRW